MGSTEPSAMTGSIATVAHAGRSKTARRIRRHWKGVLGGGILALAIVAALGADVLATHDLNAQDLRNRLVPPVWSGSGSPAHILGTDSLGRDIFSRLLYGARIALLVGTITVAIQAGIGVTLGMTAGYYGGKWDMLLMRLADLQLAVPFLVLAMAFLGVLGNNLWNIILVLGIAGWVPYGRVARASTLAVREKDFIEAARALGLLNARLLVLHILPSIAAPLIVLGTQQVAAMILAEASLSYLGLGVPPPTPTWGGMVADGRNYLATAWHVATVPGTVILIVILGINLLGDWLTDWLHPISRLR